MFYKWTDKAVLEPSLILYLQVTQPTSTCFYSMFLNVLLKYKNMFLRFFIPKFVFLHKYGFRDITTFIVYVTACDNVQFRQDS